MNDSAKDSNDSQPIQIDLYGLKLKATPSPTLDATKPITLKDLRQDVCQSFLRTIRDSVGLVADLFSGARSVVRGVGALPRAIATRINGAHRLAYKLEDTAEHASVTISKLEAIQELADYVEHLQSLGIPVQTTVLSKEAVVMSLVKRDLQQQSLECAAKALESNEMYSLGYEYGTFRAKLSSKGWNLVTPPVWNEVAIRSMMTAAKERFPSYNLDGVLYLEMLEFVLPHGLGLTICRTEET